jgi:hypothetical protein
MKKIAHDLFLSEVIFWLKPKKISRLLISFLLPLALFGCLNDNDTVPKIIIEPAFSSLIATDTISSGNYKTFSIGTDAASTYAAINDYKGSIDLDYLNIVSNIYNDLSALEGKFGLYHSIFLDEKSGTSLGVQLTVKDNRIETIFLNSGKSLEKWPEELKQTAIRKGDDVAELFGKLQMISEQIAYKNKFEAINLLTKDLSKVYDPQMAASPQWYFAYTVEENKMDVVKLNFKEGILNNIIVNHFQTY